MKKPEYPFAAIVGQEQLKTALLLAAVDWRLGVLLRGDKGAGKTTAARALAELLPAPARFINLPLGVTEDRLLGGINLEHTLQGRPDLRHGLLAEADGGVLYVDEVNLLPDHLADALLDAAATGTHTLEREGFSASQDSRFVLSGSMNPEEGSLRPQLLDRFALVVDIAAPANPDERRQVVQRRIEFDTDPIDFVKSWATEQAEIREQIVIARESLLAMRLPAEMLEYISNIVCDHGVTSLRADLATARASSAHAALLGKTAVSREDVDTVLPLAIAHRTRRRDAQHPSGPQPSQDHSVRTGENSAPGGEMAERQFASVHVDAPVLHRVEADGNVGRQKARTGNAQGPVIRTRASEQPVELDAHASVVAAIVQTGESKLSREHLRERIRQPQQRSRYLFVIDSSGSHAAGERMRAVKGVAVRLIENSVHSRDEVAMIVFRGVSAEVLIAPTRDVEAVRRALEYLQTGGRTPLAHALDFAKHLIDDKTLLILLTDGRANVPFSTNDPWADALHVASTIGCPVLVVDTELRLNATGRAKDLANAIHAKCMNLEEFEQGLGFGVLQT